MKKERKAIFPEVINEDLSTAAENGRVTVNYVMVTMLNKAVMAYCKALTQHSPEGTEENYEQFIRISCLRSENQTQDLPNTCRSSNYCPSAKCIKLQRLHAATLTEK